MRAKPHVLKNRVTGEVKAHLNISPEEAEFYSDEEFVATCEDVAGSYDSEIHLQKEKGKPPKIDRVERKKPKKDKD